MQPQVPVHELAVAWGAPQSPLLSTRLGGSLQPAAPRTWPPAVVGWKQDWCADWEVSSTQLGAAAAHAQWHQHRPAGKALWAQVPQQCRAVQPLRCLELAQLNGIACHISGMPYPAVLAAAFQKQGVEWILLIPGAIEVAALRAIVRETDEIVILAQQGHLRREGHIGHSKQSVALAKPGRVGARWGALKLSCTCIEKIPAHLWQRPLCQQLLQPLVVARSDGPVDAKKPGPLAPWLPVALRPRRFSCRYRCRWPRHHDGQLRRVPPQLPREWSNA